jgi:type III secretion system low calcium response chaperone LcrH/SycD
VKGNQKEGIKRAVEQLGGDLGQQHGKDFQKLSREALAHQMVPKRIMGLSDAMVEGLYSQAYRLYNTGKYKDASQLFRLLIMMDSTEAKFAMGLAACFHMMKEYSNALSMYALCGIIDPESPIPHYHVSDCYIQMKDNVSAIISLEMAIKRAGEKPEYQALKDRALMSIESLRKESKPGTLPIEEEKAKKKK